MEEIIIRRGVQADKPVLLHFELGVITAERPFDPTLKPGEIHYYDLDKLMSSEEAILLVAEKNAEPIGCGYALIKSAESYLVHLQYGYLGFMYVKPEFRGLGVIALILDALKSWCNKKGISEIRLEVYEDNLPAIKAYQKSGFNKHMVIMRMNLADL